MVDVAVGDKQLLLGQVVSPDGQPRVGVRVAVTTHDGRYAETKTNDQGAFAFRGVSGKAELIGPNCRQPVRAWSGGAAPPSATPAVLLVEGSVLARGQRRPGPFVE
ncbi:MAG: carboxypeptidase-like regulatory domain-containing protein, partial [Planctomycetota bacterium]